MKDVSYNMFLGDFWKRGLSEACAETVARGFNAVEMLDFCPLRSKSTYEKYTVEEYREAFKAHGLTLSCYSSAALLYHESPEAEEAMLNEAYRQVEFTAALGSKLFHHTFTICLPADKEALTYGEVLEKVVPVAKKIADRCKELGVTALYEPQGRYFNGMEGFCTLLNEMKRLCTNVGVCADVGNPLFSDCDPVALTAAVAEDVKHVHLKDYIRTDAPLAGKPSNQVSKAGKYLYDCPIGEGIVDIGGFLKVLERVGYDGDLSYEIVGDAEQARKAIAYVNGLI